jgi:hypothetical protein
VAVLTREFHYWASCFFATALKKLFRIDWPSCLKVMIDCHFTLLIWAILAIIWTWSFAKWGYILYTTPTLSQHNWLAQTH